MLNETLSVIQIILQLGAAILAVRIGKMLDARLWWTITVAFSLMALRRLTALLINLELMPSLQGAIGTFDRIYIPLLISIFLTIGIYGLYKRLKQGDTKTDKK